MTPKLAFEMYAKVGKLYSAPQNKAFTVCNFPYYEVVQ